MSILKRLGFGRSNDLTPRPPADRPTHDLVLYKFDSCPYCRRVMSVIDALNVDMEMRDTRSDRQWQKDLIDKTGRTQVPCLFIDGEPMFESADINNWLRANYAV